MFEDRRIENKAGPRAFLHSFAGTWFSLMSGGLSVPLAVLAFFVGPVPARVVLIITAFVCFCSASYVIWRLERVKAIDLARKLEPTVRLTFFSDAVEKITITEFVSQYHHIGQVENTGGTDIKECKVQLQVRGENESRVNVDLYPFQPFALARGERKRFALIIVVPKDATEASIIGHYVEYPKGNWHYSTAPFRLDLEAYRILLVVLSDAAPPIKRLLRLSRTGNRWKLCYAAAGHGEA